MADPKKLAAVLAKMPIAEVNPTEFAMWKLQNDVVETPDYDMKGFFRGLMSGDPMAASSVNSNDQQMHFPDKWKLPNHESFSTDSQYYDRATMPNIPTWSGGALPNGGDSWTLRRPDGSIVAAEAPWYKNGIKGK
jgi:hypothetical protein